MARHDDLESTLERAHWPVDLAEFRTYRRLGAGEGDSIELERAIEAGCEFVEGQTGQYLRLAQALAIFTDTDGRLWLPGPVVSTEGPWWDHIEVEVRRGMRDYWGDASNTDWDLLSGQPWTLSTRRSGQQYRIGYQRGYLDPGQIPAGLLDVCFRAASAFYENREAGVAGVLRAAFGLLPQLRQYRDVR